MSGTPQLIQSLMVVLPVLYFLTAILYAMHFGGPTAPTVRAPRGVATLLALAVHLSLLLMFVFGSHAFDPWTTLSAVAFGLGLLYLLTRMRVDDEGAGAVIFGVIAVMQLIASAAGPIDLQRTSDVGDPVVYTSHVATSIMAASALILSGLNGFMYITVLRRMRRGKFGPIVERLPDLRTLARLTRRAALAGFLLLALGVNIGIGWAHAISLPDFHYTDPWVLAMIVLWLHFGLVAFSRVIPRFSAQRASLAAVLGLSAFLIAGLIALIPSDSFHWSK